MVSKRGELTTNEILEIILAVVAVLVMAYLLYGLISPRFDKTDKTAESYFKSFNEVISDGGGSFSMWQPENSGEVFYFAYFGGDMVFYLRDGDSISKFFSFGDNVNHFCICYLDKEVKCNYCSNLDMPLVFEGKTDESWILGVGEKVNVVKRESYYEVSVE